MAKLRTKFKRRHVIRHTLELTDDERHSLHTILNIVIVQYPKGAKQMTPPEVDDVLRIITQLESVRPEVIKAAQRRSKHRAVVGEFVSSREQR